MTVSYAGTGMQSLGPINSAWGMTLSATYIILKALLDPDGPSGCSWQGAITVEGPLGSMVNPRPGAAVYGGGIEVGPRICDLIMSALSGAIPERVTGAPYGTIDTSFISGTDPSTGDYWIYNDWIPGGWGACHDHDGQNCMIILVANTDDIPIEVCELKYPLRYRFSELIMDSGGPGRYRGGLGVTREIEVLADQARASIQADRTRTAPWGIFGGGPASRTRYSVLRPDGSQEVIGGIGPDGSYQSAKRHYNLKHGEILRIESAGGGGYGDPGTRDRDMVRDDVRKGYVSEHMAKTAYGL
jgi:N-methylhydantoinase B